MKGDRMTWARGLCWGCLLGDGGAGLLLLAAPRAALARMGVSTLPAEPVYIRYIGVFVLFAGLSYALPLIRRDALRTVFELTLLLRVLVAAFVTAAMFLHALDPGWWSVPVYDGLLAAIQAGFLRAGIRE
jgi:hypothetical protein